MTNKKLSLLSCIMSILLLGCHQETTEISSNQIVGSWNFTGEIDDCGGVNFYESGYFQFDRLINCSCEVWFKSHGQYIVVDDRIDLYDSTEEGIHFDSTQDLWADSLHLNIINNDVNLSFENIEIKLNDSILPLSLKMNKFVFDKIKFLESQNVQINRDTASTIEYYPIILSVQTPRQFKQYWYALKNSEIAVTVENSDWRPVNILSYQLINDSLLEAEHIRNDNIVMHRLTR